MNIILFNENEIKNPLSITDPRAIHILEVLKRKTGESFDAGVINGPKGKGIIREITVAWIRIEFTFTGSREPETLFPITIIAGFARPQTARKILQEAASLGVSGIYFVSTEKTESSYRESRLWTNREYEKYLIAGAEQAFCTHIPEVRLFDSLSGCVKILPEGKKIALDNYEASIALSACRFDSSPIHLFVGPEKGWSNNERNFFRNNGAVLAGLGKRVLRMETACIAGIVLTLSGMGLL